MSFKRSLSYSLPCRFLKAPKFDVKFVTNNLHLYEKSIRNRNLVDGSKLLEGLQALPELYQNEKVLLQKISDIQSRRKSLEGLIKVDKSKIEELGEEFKHLKEAFKTLSDELNTSATKSFEICSSLPNLISSDAPLTKPEIIQWINPKESLPSDERRHHVDIMVTKNMLDLKTASNISGTSWYYLLNEGAELEHALVSFAIAKAKEAGFQICIPPSIVRDEIIDACGFRPRDMNNEQQIYHIDKSQLGLTATAEISLAGLGVNKVVDLCKGPKKIAGVSRSYRSEAGARGKDTKGLYRVHEFTKVELFCWSKPKDSENVLEELKDFQIDLIKSLGLTAKVLNMPTNDLGAPAYKKYDIEAWMPGRGSFGEITSTSNCLDFQSRRMNTKFKNEYTGKLEFVHTLNGTAMAVPRMILSLIENFYDPNNKRISIPDCLRQYMGGKEYIQ